MQAAIETEGLRKSFGSVRALDGIDMVAREGSVFGLLGPNGAGKTTAVRVLSTLLRPDSGRASVGGFDVVRQPREVRRLVDTVVSPAPDLTAGKGGASVIPAVSDRYDPAQIQRSDRYRHVAQDPDSELALCVPAPASRGSIDDQRTGVRQARSDRNGARKTHDRGRHESGRRRPVTYGTARIEAPAPDLAVREQRARMRRSRGQPHDVLEARDRHWHQSVNRRTVPELPDVVGAPAMHRPVIEHSAGESVSHRYGPGRSREAGDDARLDPVRRGAVTEPTVAVHSPAPNSTVGVERAEERVLRRVDARVARDRQARVLDARLVEDEADTFALGDFPLVGFFANGEICNNRLYGYTGVLALFL